MKSPIQLTPISEDFPWYLRLLEILLQVLSLVVLGPFFLVYRGIDWLLEKAWNS